MYVFAADCSECKESGLALTPAAVSRNVAMLERSPGVRRFQRSTRRLTLTEAGERFLAAIAGNLEALQSTIAAVSLRKMASQPACSRSVWRQLSG